MKILNKKIWNKAATFLLTAVLLCSNVVQVEAYTADTALTGYPYIIDDFELRLYDGNGLVTEAKMTLESQNSYHCFLDSVYENIESMSFGNYYSSYVLPLNLDLHDYYFVGTVACTVADWIDIEDFVGGFYLYTVDNTFSSQYTYFDKFDLVSFDAVNTSGFSFYSKLSVDDTTNFPCFRFGLQSIPVAGDVWFSASIVPVAKGSEVEQFNQSILNELIKINQNLVTSNSLQQSTIDAINNHDTNVGNWFTTLTGNLGNWIATLTNKVSLGFEALYNQMTDEQDEQLYGYQDTTTSEAASAFLSESDKLTALEGELSTQSNTYVTDYAAEGFDLGVLATLGSSLIFVTTWFTNFWNMGGVFTACLNFCFALSIVFFILRMKR